MKGNQYELYPQCFADTLFVLCTKLQSNVLVFVENSLLLFRMDGLALTVQVSEMLVLG